jgi:hypothetical protein
MLCVLSDETVIRHFQDAQYCRIPSSDGNLIIFENLDIPIAIEVPRFPLYYMYFHLYFLFLVLVLVNNLSISSTVYWQNQGLRLKA